MSWKFTKIPDTENWTADFKASMDNLVTVFLPGGAYRSTNVDGNLLLVSVFALKDDDGIVTEIKITDKQVHCSSIDLDIDADDNGFKLVQGIITLPPVAHRKLVEFVTSLPIIDLDDYENVLPGTGRGYEQAPVNRRHADIVAKYSNLPANVGGLIANFTAPKGGRRATRKMRQRR
jgi:hypothetical protein